MLKEAWELAQQIHVRDPLYVPGILNVRKTYYILGELEKVEYMVERLEPVWSSPLLGAISAQLNANRGNMAEGIQKLREIIPPGQSGNYAYTAYLLPLLRAIADYHSVLDGVPEQYMDPLALSRLGRFEDAQNILSLDAERGLYLDSYIQILEENLKYEEIIELVESRFDNLDEFESRYAGSPGYGHPGLGRIAYAYLKTGNNEKFEQVKDRFGASLDRQLIAGANNKQLSFAFADHALLNNDEESALNYYQQAIDQGLFLDPRWPQWREIFNKLTAHPRFQEIHGQLTSRVNRERAKLGLEPVPYVQEGGP
jgi:hypothetical protein